MLSTTQNAVLPLEPNPNTITSNSFNVALGVLNSDLLSPVQTRLQAIASSDDFFTRVLGEKTNTAEIQAIRSQWAVGDFSIFPKLQILDAAVLGEAFGAYSQTNQTIYLSDALLANGADDCMFGATGVLIEETFHWLDSLVGDDTPGDEGELARHLAFGVTPSGEELARIGQEQDQGLLWLNGQATPVELSSDFAGNTFATARNITLSSTPRTFRDWVGSTDTLDYYRFTLNQTSTVNLSLTGLSADADLGLLDANGRWLAGNRRSGTASESITRELNAGTYFIEVRQWSGSTFYNLTASATPTLPTVTIAATDAEAAETNPGQTPNPGRFTLTRTGSTTHALTVNYSIGGTATGGTGNNADYTIGGTSISVNFTNRTGTVTFAAGSSTAVIDINPINDTLVEPSETVILTLVNSSNYLVGTSNRATVTILDNDVASPPVSIPPLTGFNSTYGYGLVNAAAAVARAIGQTSPFPDVPNLGGNNWGNDMVNAPEVWARGYTGRGVVVAVIDSGVDIYHEDLRDNIWRNLGEIPDNGIDDDGNGYIDDIHGWNFGMGQNNNNVLPGTSHSAQRHGTHVAGTIAAARNNIGHTGVAYDAKIMPIRMGDVGPDGYFVNGGNLAQAIRYAVDNGANVINMSIGWSDSTALRDALAYAASRNVITVSAAGNNSLRFPGNPAQYATQYGLSVGAVDRNRNIAQFSNRSGTDNNMRHVVAPGVEIYSTLPNNSYGLMRGTSMAAPHVAGVVALMLSANPNLTPAQVRDIIAGSAVRLS